MVSVCFPSAPAVDEVPPFWVVRPSAVEVAVAESLCSTMAVSPAYTWVAAAVAAGVADKVPVFYYLGRVGRSEMGQHVLPKSTRWS